MKSAWKEILFGFGDKSTEAQYKTDYYQKFAIQLKFGFIISILIYLAFYYIDAWVFAALEHKLLLNRIAVAATFTLFFIITFTGFFKRHLQLLLLLFGLVAALGVLWKLDLLHKNGYDFSFFYPGLILISAIVSFYMRIRFVYAGLLNLIIITAYIATYVLFIHASTENEPSLEAVFVNSLFFLVCSSLLCMFGSYYLEKESRKAFLVKAEIEDINTNLETLVKQRTLELEKEKKKNINLLIEGQERESKRIARELHDNINSQLALLKFDLEQQIKTENFVNLPKSIENLLKINNDVRNLAHKQSSWTLQKLGLNQAMHKHLSNLTGHCMPQFKLHIYTHEGQIPEKMAVAFYRVFQEALSNIIKHAQASQVEIQLIKTEDSFNLSIVDNGRGFIVNARHNGGLGLENMKARIEAEHSGSLIIDSKPGQGTTLIADIKI